MPVKGIELKSEDLEVQEDCCYNYNWVVPEKIHTPPTEEISAVRRGRGDKIVSDKGKCIRTSEGGRGVNFQFPPWGWYGCFLE
jgi:hypothetical protein